MIPDDHDILNNFDRRHVLDPTLAPFVEGAAAAFVAYQQALRLDVPEDDGPGPVRAYFARRVGRVGLLFVDARMERALRGDTAHPLWGGAQWSFLQVRLWRAHTHTHSARPEAHG